jgi:hypothetical protein
MNVLTPSAAADTELRGFGATRSVTKRIEE